MQPESVQVSGAAATPASSGVPTGEWRQVTALFADIAGFTAVPERLGEEGTFALIRRCMT
jgi:class 3 adenylate cyclase